MKSGKTTAPVSVSLISLGCAKNLVDAEVMLGALLRSGVAITNEPAEADVVIVNTCSFIDAAQEESVDTILEAAEARRARKGGQGLIVAGCLPQRYREELPKLLPEVDAFIGIDQVAAIGETVREVIARKRRTGNDDEASPQSGRAAGIVSGLARVAERDATTDSDGRRLRGTDQFGRTKTVVGGRPPSPPTVQVNLRPRFVPDFATPRFRLTPKHFAYVKIAEGCNHPCSFCIIPRIRGGHRSRPQRDVVQEARQLLAEGVKELNLISQDTTFYGLDLRRDRSGSIAAPEKFAAASQSLQPGATTLSSLLRELNALPGDFSIRLLYTHPAHWTDELIDTIAASPKVARYVDIPLQHIHDAMLQRMRRETSRQYIVDLLARIRASLPGIALRTTFIVGFPGETEAHFESLLEFIRTTRFERLGVFTYSREDGTVAGRMAGQVPEAVKHARRDRAMAEQHAVARSVSQSFVGRHLRVLIEQEASAREIRNAKLSSWEHGLIRENDSHRATLRGSYLVARSQADAPDIDGRVYVRGTLPPGEFADVRIIGHTDYDLVAEPAGDRSAPVRA